MMCHEMCIFVEVQEILGALSALSMYHDLKFTDCNMNS